MLYATCTLHTASSSPAIIASSGVIGQSDLCARCHLVSDPFCCTCRLHRCWQCFSVQHFYAEGRLGAYLYLDSHVESQLARMYMWLSEQQNRLCLLKGAEIFKGFEYVT